MGQGSLLEKLRPRLRTVLLIVNLAVLILPLGSLLFFRIYENQLVRQTESELISQGAVLAAVYRQEVLSLRPDLSDYGRKTKPLPTEKLGDYIYVPILPTLDLNAADPLPDRPDGKVMIDRPDETALVAGKILNAIIAEARKSTLAGLKILDHNGVEVAGRAEVGQSFAHVQEVARALDGKYASVIRKREITGPLPSISGLSRSTGIRVFVAYPIIYHDRLLGVAYLSRTPNSILQHIYAQRRTVVLAALTIVGLTLLLALLTSATISRPINRLIRRARRISEGDVEALQPMHRPGTQEMAMLSKSFSDMAISLHDRSEYIRNFASHVSHEFKTPLTSIQGAAELLSEHYDTMSGKERARFISNIQGDTNRLEKLVTRLLELARADSITPSGETTDIAAGLAALKADYNQLRISGSDGTVALSPENFVTVFSNLVENAFHHNADEVTIETELAGDNACFTVRDNGDGISPANRQKIFTPFFTTRRANGGTGLGLGIVQSIVEAHGGTVEVLASDKGAVFKVSLPCPLSMDQK
ncbi:MAG TPA: HAMP domain-containing protein [Rhizobiales bacterium]|nr:HAMP domain-containing protein [Hyphomicrobiales bacterium]